MVARWLDRAGDKKLWLKDAAAAAEDREDLLGADMLLLLTSVPRQGYTTGGSHTEFGMALAAGIPVAVLGRRENVFHHLPEVRQFETPGSLVSWLREVNSGQRGDDPGADDGSGIPGGD